MTNPPLRRQLWYFGIFALLMSGALSVVYEATATIVAHRAVAYSPDLTKLLDSTLDRYGSSSDSFESATAFRDLLDQLAPVTGRMSWFGVAAFSSLSGFALLGFFYVRISGKLEWALAFPLLSILTGQNPAMINAELAEHGVATARLTLLEQAGVVAVQLVSVYAFGALGRRLYRRRALLEPKDQSSLPPSEG